MDALTLTTAPTVEPLTLTEAKSHLRVDASAEDGYISDLVGTAREMAEELTGRAFLTQTWTLWLDRWPASGIITLPRPPLQTVTSVLYYDVDDGESTFASSNYLVDANAEPGRIILNDGATWPTTSLRPAHAVKVTYVAGYGTLATSVPKPDVHLTRLLLSHMYENREGVVVGTIVAQLPWSIRQLVWQNRVTGAV